MAQFKTLPMKTSKVCTEQIAIRVEPELKESFRRLTYLGVDAPELLRKAIRETISDALKSLPNDLTA